MSTTLHGIKQPSQIIIDYYNIIDRVYTQDYYDYMFGQGNFFTLIKACCVPSAEIHMRVTTYDIDDMVNNTSILCGK